MDPIQITTITAFSVHALASQTTLAIPKKVAKENAKLTLIVQMISRVKTTAVRIHVLDRNVPIMHFAPQLITTPYALVPTNPLGILTTNALLSQQVRNKTKFAVIWKFLVLWWRSRFVGGWYTIKMDIWLLFFLPFKLSYSPCSSINKNYRIRSFYFLTCWFNDIFWVMAIECKICYLYSSP